MNKAPNPNSSKDRLSKNPGTSPVVAGGLATPYRPIGTFADKYVAEKVDPFVESAYWRANHEAQSWDGPGTNYNDFEPAYRMGFEHRARQQNVTWEDVESELEKTWEIYRGDSRLPWAGVKPATQASWNRMDQRLRRNTGDPSTHQIL